VRLGIDVGSVRVGVAASDPDGMLATPVTVLKRDVKGASDLVEIARLVSEREAVEVVVGLPRSLNGGEGRAALIAREYASVLAERVAPVSVRMVDERLSTVEATRGLQQAGIKAKEARKMIDAAAAVVILQHALDADRSNGGRP
jgi:putative Holliday junction resolvase